MSEVERGVRICGCSQRMIKDVVEISTHLETVAFAEMEFLAQAKIGAPGAGPRQGIAPKHIDLMPENEDFGLALQGLALGHSGDREELALVKATQRAFNRLSATLSSKARTRH